MFNFFNKPVNSVSKPPVPKPQPTPPQQTNWNASQKTDTQRNRAYFREVAPNGEHISWNVQNIPTFNPFN